MGQNRGGWVLYSGIFHGQEVLRSKGGIFLIGIQCLFQGDSCLGQEVGQKPEVWFLSLGGLGKWRKGAERGEGGGADRLMDGQI